MQVGCQNHEKLSRQAASKVRKIFETLETACVAFDHLKALALYDHVYALDS